MAKGTPPGACPNPQAFGGAHECVNIERVRAEVNEKVGDMSTDVGVIGQKVDDLRLNLAQLPRQVTEMIEREHRERSDRLKRGEGHFDELFRRFGKIEKQVLVIWVLLRIIGAGKLVVWMIPVLTRLF